MRCDEQTPLKTRTPILHGIVLRQVVDDHPAVSCLLGGGLQDEVLREAEELRTLGLEGGELADEEERKGEEVVEEDPVPPSFVNFSCVDTERGRTRGASRRTTCRNRSR